MGRTINPDDLTHSSHRAMEQHRWEQVRFPKSKEHWVAVSKALSRLLRHQAENYNIPITKDGWVRLDHVLAWKGLNGRNGVSASIEQVFAAVEDNEKKRFALKLVKEEKESTATVKAKDVGVQSSELDSQPAATVDEITGDKSADAQRQSQSVGAGLESDETTKSDTETARAIAYYRNSTPPPPASEFMIRATQGHSIKTITSDTGLLKPITLSDSSTIPSTCVHGTFYGSWLTILGSGGLKRMGRNHVHFAEGPTLAELGLSENGEKTDSFVGERKEVISGMRRDAELLIYVDVKSALEGEKDMKWWKSENGVILTEGALIQAEDTTNDGQDNVTNIDVDNSKSPEGPSTERQEPTSSTVDQVSQDTSDIQVKGKSQRDHKANKQHGKGKHAQASAQENKMVPTKYWTVVIDAKGGRGVIWRQGEGVVQELPERLTSRGTPKGRGRGGGRGGSRGRGRG